MTQRVEIPRSRSKTVWLLVGSLVFVALGAWALADADTFAAPAGRARGPVLVRGAGLASVLFFGLTAALAARKLFSRAPGLVLDGQGLTDNTSALAAGFIPWSDVARVEAGAVAGQRLLYVVLRDPEAYVRKAPPLRRAVLAQNQRLGMGTSPVALSAVALDVGFDDLATLVRGYWEAARPGRL